MKIKISLSAGIAACLIGFSAILFANEEASNMKADLKLIGAAMDKVKSGLDSHFGYYSRALNTQIVDPMKAGDNKMIGDGTPIQTITIDEESGVVELKVKCLGVSDKLKGATFTLTPKYLQGGAKIGYVERNTPCASTGRDGGGSDCKNEAAEPIAQWECATEVPETGFHVFTDNGTDIFPVTLAENEREANATVDNPYKGVLKTCTAIQTAPGGLCDA